jgi:hypothetical protein
VFHLQKAIFQSQIQTMSKRLLHPPIKRIKLTPINSYLLHLAPELLDFVLSFLAHDSTFENDKDDNQIYRNLCLTTKSWKMETRQHLFCFNLNMFRCRFGPRKAHVSWIHAICCQEISMINPKELSTDILIPMNARHTYKVPVVKKSDLHIMGRCCWMILTKMNNLTSLRLFSVITDDFSDFLHLKNLELHVKQFGLPLRFPSTLQCLTLDFMKTPDFHLRQMQLYCPLNLISLTIRCDDCCLIGSINLNANLTNLSIEDCAHIDHIHGGDSLKRISFENCIMSTLPSLERFTILETLEMPYPDEEEGTTMDGLIWRIGILPSLREFILPSSPVSYRRILNFTNLENVIIHDSLSADKAKILFQLPKMRTIKCGAITFTKTLQPRSNP